MRVGIQTWGTEGDVRPFFALARALAARGHEVRVVYTNVEGREFSALAQACGVDATAVGRAWFVDHREELEARSRAGMQHGSPLEQMRVIFEHFMDPVLDEMHEASQALTQWSDLLIGHFLTFPLAAAAQQHRKAFVAVAMQPVLPTRHHPPIGAPDLGRVLNPLLWRLGEMVADRMSFDRVAKVRARCGLPPIRRLFTRALDGVDKAIIALSPSLFSRPPDWDPRIRLTGFLSLVEASEAWTPEPALRDFLDAGPPPAFLSFGSMLTLDEVQAAESVRALHGAVIRAGGRGVIQAPGRVIDAAPKDERICYVERAPHARLFPRCAAIVHHGGAGTTQAALLAGRPSVIVPHVTDQFWFGARLHARGVATKPLPRKKLHEEPLAARLREVFASPEMTTRAQALGESLRGEDGPARAADEIEELLARAGAPG